MAPALQHSIYCSCSRIPVTSDCSSSTVLQLLRLLQLYSTPVTLTAPALQYSSYSDCSSSTVLQLLQLLQLYSTPVTPSAPDLHLLQLLWTAPDLQYSTYSGFSGLKWALNRLIKYNGIVVVDQGHNLDFPTQQKWLRVSLGVIACHSIAAVSNFKPTTSLHFYFISPTECLNQ